MSSKIGAKALSGEAEFISGMLFEPVDYDRTITGRGKLIQVYNPKVDMASPPYWIHENPSEDATGNVPKGFEVHVVSSTVKFT